MSDLNMNEIKRLYKSKVSSLIYTIHAVQRMAQHNIRIIDIAHALQNGIIIEQCPDYYPTPSCFIMGLDLNNNPIHIVCAVFQKELFIVTAYYPISDSDINTFTKRGSDSL